ncbi:MAG TPA: BTAD domain-containing putative transcriptional regulator [Mycobacteriales bacterium]|nr:BTAD domain-containing putative transcriptional regulator [Mycobacteriales bacterium]
MQIGLLGPLEVRDGATVIEISGGRLRTLLAMLALDAPRAVSSSALVEALWGDEPPADAANALQSLVSRLRRTLGAAGVVQQAGSGYQLAVESPEVDVNRFEALARAGREAFRAGDAASAERDLAAAVALWRGEPLDGLTAADAVRTRLDEVRLEALADLAQSRLALGRAEQVIPELESLVVEHPLRERYAELLVRALHASGRSAEALASYERTRATLADLLGADPGPDLQAAHLAVLRGDPAPTNAVEQPRGNLRATLTSFVGRETQLVQIGNLLETSRLVTLVGPGGAGKTRLATAAAASRGGSVWLAELAPVTDPADVPAAVLGALGQRDAMLLDRQATSPRDAMGRLVDALSGRHVLLVLDNCEHLVEAAAQLADRLLAECPDLRVVATSREPLAIFGEALVAVPPLDQPAADADPAEALRYAAVQLFADRARDVRSDFAVDETTVGSVVEIVRRLDGLPLAIELAAARLRALPVDEIARRLSDRFKLLTGGSRTAMPRHRTLHAVVEWSWDLLSVDERQLAQRLAVFSGGITPTAAAAVCAGAVGDGDVDELLASLVDKSLLQVAAKLGTTPRYRMLETIREFGLERMAEAGVVGEARLAHAEYFAARVHEADQYLRTAAQLPWIEMLEVERDNILAGVKYLSDIGRANDAMDLIGKLGWHWMTVGNHGEILTWVSFVLDGAGDIDPAQRLLAESFLIVNSIGWMARGDDDDEQVAANVERVRQLAGEVAELVDSGNAPSMLELLAPIVAMFADDQELSERLVAKALSSPDTWVAAAARAFSAAMAENVGDVVRMREDAEIALAAFRQLGERWGIANSLQILGQIDLLEGKIESAADSYREALDLAVGMGSREDVAMMRLRLADIYSRLGDLDAARAQIELGREAAEQSGSPVEVLFTGIVDVEIARSMGHIEEAARARDISIRALRELSAAHPMQSHGLAIMLSTAAKVELDLGNGPAAAAPYLSEAYEKALETKDLPLIAAVGVALALTSVTLEDLDGAAEVLGAAAALRGADDFTQIDIVRLAERLGGLLEGPHASAYARGRAMARQEAIARIDPRQARLL